MRLRGSLVFVAELAPLFDSRRQKVEELIGDGSEKAIQSLASFVRDDHVEVREAALKGLGKLKSRESMAVVAGAVTVLLAVIATATGTGLLAAIAVMAMEILFLSVIAPLMLDALVTLFAIKRQEIESLP